MDNEIRLGDDARIEDFRNALLNVVNKEQLPLYVKELIIEEIHQAVTRERVKIVKSQREVYAKKIVPGAKPKIGQKSGTKEEFIEDMKNSGVKITKVD